MKGFLSFRNKGASSSYFFAERKERSFPLNFFKKNKLLYYTFHKSPSGKQVSTEVLSRSNLNKSEE